MEPTLQPLSPRQQTSHGPRGRSPDFDGERVSVLRIVALIAVPALWGSYTPALKMLLDGRNVPPPVVTNLASHVVGFLSLLFLWYLQPGGAKLPEDPAERRRAMHASLELGTYLFFGQLTQLLGLAGTSATTNAVLVQSSVVIIPLLDSAGFESRRWRTPSGFAIRMLPSTLAFGGVALITGVGAPGAGEEGENTPLGLAFSMASAVFYAMHTLRLSAYGDVDPTVQAVGQVGVNTLIDVVALPLSALFPGGGAVAWLVSTGKGARKRLGRAALWNGVFVVGATTWSMSYAQQACSASTAALAYATEPLFAAVLAAFVLGDSISSMQLAGGALVFAANVLAAIGMQNILARASSCERHQTAFA